MSSVEHHPLHFIDRFIELVGRAIAWLTLAMVLLSFAIVVLRYGFNLGWVAMQESVLYLHGIVFMLGAAYTLKHDGHVRVDIYYQRMTEKQQAWVNLLGAIFLLLPVCGFIFYISFDYVATSWSIAEKSSEAGGLALVYLNKSLLLLMPSLLTLQALSQIVRNVLLIKQPADIAMQKEQ